MAEIPQFEISRRITSNSEVAYRVLQRLGQGGNSHVYLVEALTGPNRGLLFALKLFVQVSDATRLARFNQEVKFLSECKHPAIMRVYDDGKVVEGGKEQVIFPFVIADYLPRTLFDSLRSGLSMVEKVSFALQLLSAASFLESSTPKIVHRDIKPQNIFVRGKACILGDFGLIKFLPDEAGDGKDREFIFHSVGPRLPKYFRTPDLVEYCKGKGEITPKSDVFQLGLVFAVMFTGLNPLKSSKDILAAIEMYDVGDCSGALSDAIKPLLIKMVELDVAKRPSATELFDAWEGIFLRAVNMANDLEGRVF